MICPLKCGVHGALLMRCQSERPLKRSALPLCCSASSCCCQSIIARRATGCCCCGALQVIYVRDA